LQLLRICFAPRRLRQRAPTPAHASAASRALQPQATPPIFYKINNSSILHIITNTAIMTNTDIMENTNIMTTTDILQDSPVTLTQGAIRQLEQIRQQQNLTSEHALRVGVKGGGCSGFSYVLGFDVKKEGDDEFMIGGMNVLMNKAHAIYLLGIEIDFLDGLQNRGFTFNNPNAASTCGCGTSFSA
jgi:iron-sulfur cluster assembly protein